jgi:hypothetical protein
VSQKTGLQRHAIIRRFFLKLLQLFLKNNRGWAGGDFAPQTQRRCGMVDGDRDCAPQTQRRSRNGRWSLAVEGGRTNARPTLRVLLLRAEGGQGALPDDEMYKDRGASFVGQANTLKEIYVSCGCGRRMRDTRRRCQPAIDLRFRRGFDNNVR